MKKQSSFRKVLVSFQQGNRVADPRTGKGRPGPIVRRGSARAARTAASDDGGLSMRGSQTASGESLRRAGADRSNDAGAGGAGETGSGRLTRLHQGSFSSYPEERLDVARQGLGPSAEPERGRAEAARGAHNAQVGGSNPPPATGNTKPNVEAVFVIFDAIDAWRARREAVC